MPAKSKLKRKQRRQMIPMNPYADEARSQNLGRRKPRPKKQVKYPAKH